jgi:hypothetical protein
MDRPVVCGCRASAAAYAPVLVINEDAPELRVHIGGDGQIPLFADSVEFR